MSRPTRSSTTVTSATSARRSCTTSTSPAPIPTSRPRSRSCSQSERFAAFGPDTLAEARNRGYRPASVDPASRSGHGGRGVAARAARDRRSRPSVDARVRRRRDGRVRPGVRGVLPYDAAAPRRERDGRGVLAPPTCSGVLFAWDAETNTGLPPVTNDFVAGCVAAHPDAFLGFASVDPLQGRRRGVGARAGGRASSACAA